MKRLPVVFCVLVFSALFGAGLLAVFLPGHSFSQAENRTLKTVDSLSPDLLAGGFQTDFENLLCDQFPGRNTCVAGAVALKRFFGRQDLNGAYIGQDGSLFQKITQADLSLDEIAAHAARYADAGKRAGEIPVTVMPVPSAGTVNPSRLPKGAEMYDLAAVVATVKSALPGRVIELGDALFENRSCYYKTDHHWTATGAYLAYRAWCEAHAIDPLSLEEMKLSTVSTAFFGTLHSKIPGLSIGGDSLQIPAVYEGVTVTADGQEIPFYDQAALATKDQYRVFLSGNHGITVVKNPQLPTGKTLLIFKDSFANSFVPYLVHHYGTIVLVDERYTIANPAELSREYRADEIAVIKEAANF